MKHKESRFEVFFAVGALLLLFAPTQSVTINTQAKDELQESLAGVALSSLKAGYNVLLTGNSPDEGLVSQYDGLTLTERSGAQRLAAVTRERQGALKDSTIYTDIESSLIPNEIKYYGDSVVLLAVEEVRSHYTNDQLPPDINRDMFEMKPKHYFIFAMSQSTSVDEVTPYSVTVGSNTYTLKEDWIDKTPYPEPAESNLIDESDTGTGYDDSNFCCYTEEYDYIAPVEDAPLQQYTASLTPQSCGYNGTSAALYAYNWALSRNSNYRQFSNDCTNFISQAELSGGWNFKGAYTGRKNWGHWWYDQFDQTRSWTQAKANQYFVVNSGRGFNTANPCDLNLGDLIYADWNNDRAIDHAMIITNITFFNGCGHWDQIYLSYHTTDTRNRTLASIQNAVPGAKFYAYWVCHN